MKRKILIILSNRLSPTQRARWLELEADEKGNIHKQRPLRVSGHSKCTTCGRNEGLQNVPPGGWPKGCTMNRKNGSMCGHYGQHTPRERKRSDLNFSQAGLGDTTYCSGAQAASAHRPAVH